MVVVKYFLNFVKLADFLCLNPNEFQICQQPSSTMRLFLFCDSKQARIYHPTSPDLKVEKNHSSKNFNKVLYFEIGMNISKLRENSP